MRTRPLLTIELVPHSCWYSNLRSLLSKEEWDRVRKTVYSRASYKCEVCGGKGPKHPVEAHETWLYDDKKVIQTLACIRALCPKCHKVKHFGYARTCGEESAAMNHLMEVNGWDLYKTLIYIAQEFKMWDYRSRIDWWHLNLDHLKTFDFSEYKIDQFVAAARTEQMDRLIVDDPNG